MPDLKKHYDRYLLAGAGLATALVAAWIALASGSLKEAASLPPAATGGEPFAAAGDVEALRGDRAVMTAGRSWRESTNGASPFVSRIYLLKDDRLVDILEAGSDLFPGIPNSWLLEHGLDYLDSSLPTRDPDEDGFDNSEEYAAKTNPRDATSAPPDWSKLRLVDLQEQSLEFVLKSPVAALALVLRSEGSGSTLSLSLATSGSFENPPDDASGSKRQNPPSFKGRALQVNLGSGLYAEAKVTGEEVDVLKGKFQLEARVEAARQGNPRVREALAKAAEGVVRPELLVGAWINSQSADEPGKVKGHSAKYLIGQLLYVNKFIAGRATPEAEPTSFRLAGLSTREVEAPELGQGAKREAETATIESTTGNGKKTELEENQPEKSPFALATLQDTRTGGTTFTVTTGQDIKLGPESTYKLIDVSAEEATIEDPVSKDRHKVPKASPTETEPPAPEAQTSPTT